MLKESMGKDCPKPRPKLGERWKPGTEPKKNDKDTLLK